MKKTYFLLPLLLLISIATFAQDPLRFEKEILAIQEKYPDPSSFKEAVLFTGSSSIKLWKGLEEQFPGQTSLNTGFGGSHTSDLLYYVDQVVIPFAPRKVFIYEGDNDISGKKSTNSIIRTMDALVQKIKAQLPQTEIYLISAKPSISRWNLRKEYRDFNKALNKYAKKSDKVTFVDIWTIMLDQDGKPKEDLFLEDKLHMNERGYDLWAEVLQQYM